MKLRERPVVFLPRKRLAVLALGLGLLASAPGAAGDLAVNNAAAGVGSFGLEVTPGAVCGFLDTRIVNEATIVGNRSACQKITVQQGAVAGTSIFTAGEEIVFEEFSVANGAEFTAALDQTLVPFSWVRDDSPNGDKIYLGTFRMNLDMLTIGSTDQLTVLEGLRTPTLSAFEVVLERGSGGADKRLLLKARLDDGSMAETPSGEEIDLPAGWNEIDVRFEASGGTGVVLVSLNGGPLAGLTGLDNDTGAINRVRFGAPTGSLALGTTGSFYLDDFASFRTLAP